MGEPSNRRHETIAERERGKSAIDSIIGATSLRLLALQCQKPKHSKDSALKMLRGGSLPSHPALVRMKVPRIGRVSLASLSTSSLPTASSPELLVELAGGTNGKVALVQLNRPKRMNALSFEMGRALLDLLQKPSALPPSARSIVIAGSLGGKAFSTGRDLKDSKEHTDSDKELYMSLARDTARAAKASSLPIVAAINGFAFGWGLELALACDLHVSYEDAVLCFPETGLGM